MHAELTQAQQGANCAPPGVRVCQWPGGVRRRLWPRPQSVSRWQPHWQCEAKSQNPHQPRVGVPVPGSQSRWNNGPGPGAPCEPQARGPGPGRVPSGAGARPAAWPRVRPWLPGLQRPPDLTHAPRPGGFRGPLPHPECAGAHWQAGTSPVRVCRSAPAKGAAVATPNREPEGPGAFTGRVCRCQISIRVFNAPLISILGSEILNRSLCAVGAELASGTASGLQVDLGLRPPLVGSEFAAFCRRGWSHRSLRT